ncbi:MAG: DNA mismatch repair protein MutS [Ruminococcus sp.]|nr:DNA mismatch repair protein MutS [Ruminococcus sp.]
MTNIDVAKLSPMMQQYIEMKEKYSGHVLFFRVGDFYEMFFDDAKKVSKMLELTLTGKACGLEERAPMCGVPFHACDIYAKKLVDLGEKVAICEQVTDPSESKGLVVREVTKIITPGTLTESSMLNDEVNNYIGAVFVKNKDCSVCFADISTGTVHLIGKNGDVSVSEVIDEIARYSPKELLFNSDASKLKEIVGFVTEKIKCPITIQDDGCFDIESKKNAVLAQFSTESLSSLGLDEEGTATAVICGLFDYISDTQKALVGRFTGIEIHSGDNFMGLDLTARRNLELTETMRNKEKKGSLLWVLDHTHTSMGKRLLRSYIEQPLVKPALIIDRLDAVEQLCHKSVVCAEISELLERVYDLERLMTRIMYKTATPRDLKALSVTAAQLPSIKEQLSKLDSKLIRNCNADIDTLDEIMTILENAIVDEPPVSVKDGGVIREGFNDELDELRDIIENSEDILHKIEEREKERTGIKNLKIGFNRVFGYYIEVTKSNYDLVPENYIRKQSLANAERFITEELKLEENKIIGAKDRVFTLEAEIFNEVRDYIATKLTTVQKTAEAIAVIDVLASFAYVSAKNMYTKPDIAIDGVINIKDGRHPVVEMMLGDELFVPNDTYLDLNSDRMAIITGPNMSGKSTYMRQVALITLMAQIGCFVPASYAKISICDRIFTRVGASDDLTAGQSTFMVEMNEVADILRNATKHSLVILDEVGRGTSTFDGLSIAKAIAEQISNKKAIGCKTLFATHYHELISLEETLDGVKNYSVAVKKRGDEIKFLRKIVEGGADESYGIEVAKLAGIPAKVTNRAKEILAELEENKQYAPTKNYDDGQISFAQISHENIIEKLRKTNVDELTPDDAKYFLGELVKML